MGLVLLCYQWVTHLEVVFWVVALIPMDWDIKNLTVGKCITKPLLNDHDHVFAFLNSIYSDLQSSYSTQIQRLSSNCCYAERWNYPKQRVVQATCHEW